MRRITTHLPLLLGLGLCGGLVHAQEAGTSEPKELLKDQFLYEFAGNQPKHWTLQGGKPYALLQGFHPNTGKALRVTTEQDKALCYQDVLVAEHPEELATGNELQGLLHYRVEQKTITGGAIRLHMLWLNAQGEVVTTEEDKRFIDAPDLWTSYHTAPLERADTWRTLSFRTTVPAGAVCLRFAIEVNSHTQVALDDFSLTRAAKAESFISLVPQLVLPFHAQLGSPQTQSFVLQAYHLGRTYKVAVSGSADFATDVTTLDKDATSTPITLTFTPSKAGRLPYKTSDRVSLSVRPENSFGTTVEPLQVPLRAYVTDPANPPVIETSAQALRFSASIQGSEVTQVLRVSGEHLIDVVKLQLVQEAGAGFRLGASSVYFFPNAVPSANLQAGINPTDIKVSFKPGATAGRKTAKLLLTSSEAQTVEVTLTAEVSASEGGVWRELFASETSITDPRYRGGLPEGVHYYKLGLWSYAAEGVLAEPSEKQLSLLKKDSPVTFLGGFRPGALYREDFPDGLDQVNLRATYAGQGTKLALEVSYDGGGTWRRAAEPTLEQRPGVTIYSFAVNSHRPTTFRFLRTDEVPDVVNIVAVEAYPAKKEQRLQATDIIELADFTGQQARPLLEETFDGQTHHARLTLEGWQNIVLGGDRAFVFYDQHEGNDPSALIEESAAKISLYGAQAGGAPVKQVALISPLLDYVGAKTKELTCRFYKDKPAAGDAFKVSLAEVQAGKITHLYELPLNALTPSEELKEGRWYDLFIDLQQTKEFEAIREFALVFEYRDNADALEGNVATYLIDDVTFGRETNTKLAVSPELLSFFELQAERRSPAQPFRVTPTNPHGPIRCEVVGKDAQKFVLSTSEDPATRGTKPQELLLPTAGGTGYVHAYSRQVKAKDSFAAALYLQSRSASGVRIKLFATPLTEREVTHETEPGHTTPVDEAAIQPLGYVYVSGGRLVVVAPELATCEVYSLSGSLLGKYHAVADRLELPRPAASHVVLRLRYLDGRQQVIKY